MATKTPIDPRDSLHGEEEAEPRFGPGSDYEDQSGNSAVDSEQRPPGRRSPYDHGGRRRVGSPGQRSRGPGGGRSMFDRRQGRDNDHKRPGRAESSRGLGNAESAGGVSSRGKVGGAESGLSDQLGKGFTDLAGGVGGGGALGAARKLLALLARNKKKAAGGIAGGGIVGGLIFLFSVAQGPLQLVHLSEILGKNSTSQDENTVVRFRGLIRFAKTGDVSETRVNEFKSRRMATVFKQLKEIGIEFPNRTALGSLKDVTIDPDNPHWEGLTDEEIAREIAPDHPDFFKRQGNLLAGEMDPATFEGVAMQKVVPKSSLGELGNGRAITALDWRWFKQKFEIPNMWHPIRKVTKVVKEKLVAKIDPRQEEERAKPRIEADNSRISSARASLKDKLGGGVGKFAQGALITTGTMCLVRGIADDAIEVNRGIATAALIEAVDKMAVGSQVKSGQDISLVQAGGVSQSLTDKNGKSVFQGRALGSTAEGKDVGGTDLPGEYAQAFHRETTAANIKSAVSVDVAGFDFSAAACSGPGIAIQLVAGLVLLVAAAPTGGADLAVWSAIKGGEIAATAGVFYMIQKVFTKLLSSDAIIPIPPKGPLGGNILAYGAREAANLAARASGGIELLGTAASVADSEDLQRDQQEFQSKSFFARMFDTSDYRSLSSRFIDNATVDPAQNVSSVASYLTNLGGLASSLFSSFMPHASAQGANSRYDWGFNRYGIPKDLVTGSAYENPYKNAAKVAKILDENKDDIIGKAETCFGDKITKDSNGWNTESKEDTNPNSEEYIDANCGDLSDPDWKRIIVFTFDTHIVNAVNCYEGDEDACASIGEGGMTTAPSGGGSETPGETIDMAHLYESSVDISCAPGTKDLGVQDGYHSGTKVKIRVCAVQSVPETGETSDVPGANGKLVVNSLASGAVVKMFADAKKDGVSPIQASEGFRSMARQTQLYNCAPGCGVGDNPVAEPGTSNHQMGIAIDVDGAMQSWMIDNGQKYGFTWYGPGDEVHFSPDGS